MIEQLETCNHNYCLDSIFELIKRQLKIAYEPIEEDKSTKELNGKTMTVILIEINLIHAMMSHMMSKQYTAITLFCYCLLLFRKIMF